MFWCELREEEFDAAIKKSGGVCILPLGCIEKHGQHLPVGTDYYEAMDVVRAAVDIEDAVIFDTGPWLGEVSGFHSVKDPGRMRLRGCIGIKQSTILTVLEELCDEIARNGFQKILIVNCHGGNITMLKHFVRCQTYEGKPYATLSTFALDFPAMQPKRLLHTVMSRKADFPYITEDDVATLTRLEEVGYGGGHADLRESALIMAHDEKLVASDRFEAKCGLSTHRTDHLSDFGVEAPNAWLANFPNSYDGLPPHGASKTLGQLMRTVSAERLARIIKMLKDDETCVEIADANRI